MATCHEEARYTPTELAWGGRLIALLWVVNVALLLGLSAWSIATPAFGR